MLFISFISLRFPHKRRSISWLIGIQAEISYIGVYLVRLIKAKKYSRGTCRIGRCVRRIQSIEIWNVFCTIMEYLTRIHKRALCVFATAVSLHSGRWMLLWEFHGNAFN